MNAIHRVCLATLCALPQVLAAQQAPAASLHIEQIGSGDRTVIVLHGGPGIRHNYLRPEWDRLASSARVVYYDQRGCGLSTPIGPHHWRQHVADLHSIVDSVTDNAGQVVVAGSSWGTYLALLYALAHPERVDALVLSGLPPWPDTAQFARGLARRPEDERRLYADLQVRAVASDWILDSASVANSGGFHPSLAPRVGPSCTGAGRATSFSLTSVPAQVELRRILAPVLIVRGPLADPSIDGAASIVSVLPNGRVVTLDGTGHDPWVEQPDRFFTLVQSFLDQLPRHVPQR